MNDLMQTYASLQKEVDYYQFDLEHHYKVFLERMMQSHISKVIAFQSIHLPCLPSKKSIGEVKLALEARHHEELLQVATEIEERELRIATLMYGVLDQMEK